MEGKDSTFPYLRIPSRPAKPRSQGLTIFFDVNLSLREIADLMEHQAEMLDYAKFVDHAAMIARYPSSWIKEKIDLYHLHGIKVFIGGVTYQVAALQGKVPEYLQTLKAIGFDTVEICEDAMSAEFELAPDVRISHVKLARDLGLEVFSEFGKKSSEAPLDANETIGLMERDFEAGAHMATIENTDIRILMDTDPEPLFQIVRTVGLHRLRFEIGPNGWPEVPLWLIDQFGPEINVENVFVSQLAALDGMRRRMSREDGARFVMHDGAQLENVPVPMQGLPRTVK